MGGIVGDSFFKETIIQSYELLLLREFFKEKKIVFVSGTFDLLHLGHICFLKAAKQLGDLLVVSLGLDSVIKKNKGPHRPIISQNHRLETMAALRVVDFCFLDAKPQDDHPLATLKTNLVFLRPDIYVVNHDSFNLESRRNLVAGTNTRMEIINLRIGLEEADGPPLSTTAIINRIKAL